MADIDISKAILRYGLAAGYTGPRRRIRKKPFARDVEKTFFPMIQKTLKL